MATDKCIQVFTIINLIMVVVIVAYAIVTKRISLDGGGDGGKGDTPDVTSVDDADSTRRTHRPADSCVDGAPDGVCVN